MVHIPANELPERSTDFTASVACAVPLELVVADAVLDGELVPTELIAETR